MRSKLRVNSLSGPGCVLLMASLLLITPVLRAAPEPSTFSVLIRVDAATPQGPLKPIWRFFGADEPNFAYMKDGKKLLAELGQLGPSTAYFRAHSLLVSGDGTPALKWAKNITRL